MATRMTITRSVFLKFNPRWNDRDATTLEAMTDEFGGVAFTLVESGWDKHVKVHDATGCLTMDVSKGTVYLKGARRWPGSVPYDVPGDDQDHVYRLSTNVERGVGVNSSDPTGGHPQCMTCFLHHPEADCDR